MEDKIKTITFDTEAHAAIKLGVETMQKGVGVTYGVGGRNVLIKKKYVHPILTRDGVTVAREIAGHGNKLKDPNAAEAAKLVYQASEKTNKTAGDGTTATVLLLAELYKSGYQQIVAGNDAMVVKRKLDSNRDKVVKFIESKSVECDKKKLDQVATISCGDSELGKMISDLVYDVGSDGSITIEYQNAPHVEVEKVTGYLFGNGFKNLVGELELEAPAIFVTQKRMASKADIIPVLELMSQEQKQFIIVGDVTGAALETLLWAIQNKQADGIVIPPPAYGADGHDYFEDIAIYTNAGLFLESDSFKDVKATDLGTVKKARISRDKAILFGDNSSGDAIAERINEIKKEMTPNISPMQKEVYEQRLAKLAGKVSIVKVGAATEVEKEELFFRVEDAVEACKSALSNGIVAGGATTLLFSSIDKGLDPFVKEALQQPFRLLLKNCAEDDGYFLHETLNGGYGKGYDLRNMTEEPIELIEAGIVDATKVVLQTVKNAFSVAGALLTTGAIVNEEETDETPNK